MATVLSFSCSADKIVSEFEEKKCLFLLDEFESTSYESYEDEEEEGTAVYENQHFQENKQR